MSDPTREKAKADLLLFLFRSFAKAAIEREPLPSGPVRFFTLRFGDVDSAWIVLGMWEDSKPLMSDLFRRATESGQVNAINPVTALQVLSDGTQTGLRLNERVMGQMALYYQADTPCLDWRLPRAERSKFSHVTLFWGSDSPLPLCFADTATLAIAYAPQALKGLHYALANKERQLINQIERRLGNEQVAKDNDYLATFQTSYILGRNKWMEAERPSLMNFVTKVQTELEDIIGTGIQSPRAGLTRLENSATAEGDTPQNATMAETEGTTQSKKAPHQFVSYDPLLHDQDHNYHGQSEERLEQRDLLSYLVRNTNLTPGERNALYHEYAAARSGIAFSDYCRNKGINHKATDRLFRIALAKLRNKANSTTSR